MLFERNRAKSACTSADQGAPTGAVRVHDADEGAVSSLGNEGELAPVGRPSRVGVEAGADSQVHLVQTVNVNYPDVRITAVFAAEGNPRAVWRPCRTTAIAY